MLVFKQQETLNELGAITKSDDAIASKRDGAQSDQLRRPIMLAFKQKETLNEFGAKMKKSGVAPDTKQGDVWKQKNAREDTRGGFVRSKRIANGLM